MSGPRCSIATVELYLMPKTNTGLLAESINRKACYMIIAMVFFVLVTTICILKNQSIKENAKKKKEELLTLAKDLEGKQSQIENLELELKISKERLEKINNDIKVATEFLKKN
ncbi:hypothetical protein [uncultured Psychrobacter sp.]|uniref:hypothetical protein n=1 Tax=uncultured Psychrobacter sp. TaxID=259303 RepID=UPI002594A9E0|nr:hypothetical protein [uncultured Psychrobacter sp.]